MISISPRSGVCPEYERLLATCHKALAAWQRQAALFAHHPTPRPRGSADLSRLQANYQRAHASLERHEYGCPDCQYLSKIGGLDFESMSNALDAYQRRA